MPKDNPKQLQPQFDHLYNVISSEHFLSRKGLGNEVPFFIFPFKPTLQNEVDRYLKSLIAKLNKQGTYVLEINLYDLGAELIKGRGYWDRILEKEPSTPKDKLKEQMQTLLDPEEKLTPAIAAKMKESTFDVLFITGVGLVYPFVRTHNVLNNLQKVAKEQPLVMFFPGTYTYVEGRGSSLDLFGILNEDKYYRAFNITEYQF